ncbi:uncharacterized protein BYT42DRAFT_586812 [Radiomyces spectabilis]|uniref:uncharacterized protein n=1 Tax=Radiomyces spectabilis TaxID=64574 RepID=UPI00221EBCF1|nr:uncharacterized protein BYT42DRAFT_586812 [Radiomyces spectabilis]KAI8367588.1 hypothetical protein BYT42DRAFT_586812 [Radiomyces spectabilis]
MSLKTERRMKKSLIPGSSVGKPSTSSSTTSTADTQPDTLKPTNDVTHGTPSSVIQDPNIGIDMPILPSSSTFTLTARDDRPEKFKKKAKNFLDERQKIKTRAQSLWSYIDATNTFDQARFFQENAEQVFHVVYETCIHQIDKIKSKSERPQSWSSKELVGLQKTLLLLRKIFLYVPELMRNGWQRQNIARILSHLLDHGNHPRLRALGFHLLLLWLNDQVVEYPECMELFANAIPLDLFVLDEIHPLPTNVSTTVTHDVAAPQEEKEPTPGKLHSGGLQFVKKLSERHAERAFGHGLARDERIKSSPLKLHQSFIHTGDEQAPLFPNPSPPTFHDSIVMLHIFISNLVRLAYVAAGSPPPPDDYEYPPGDHIERDDGIATGVGIDAATASAKFLFRVFRTYYLTKFVPEIAKQLNVEGVPTDPDAKQKFGFPSCPPSILRALLRFLIGYCLDNNHSQQLHWPRPSFAVMSSPATPILKSIVLSSHETREMLHEILRQSLVLPCTNVNYRDITRGAIHILGVWILGNEDERPSFLRRTGSGTNGPGQISMTRSSSLASVSTSKASVSDNRPENSTTFSTSPTSSVASPTRTTEKTDHDYSGANVFLRRYFLMIKLIFEQHWKSMAITEDRESLVAGVQQISDWEGLVMLYKDAINVYRAITVTQGGIDMEWESWELLLRCLLDIQQGFMNLPEKYSRIAVQSLADEFAEYLCETLLHAFARARIVHMDLWIVLKNHLLEAISWPQVLSQWTIIMHKLTRLLSERLYKVDYDAEAGLDRYNLGIQSMHGGTNRGSVYFGTPASTNTRGRSRVRSRHLSIQGDHRGQTKLGTARPLSAGGSDGQLIDIPSHERLDHGDYATDTSQERSPATEISTFSLPRNKSSASLNDKASSVKTGDRRSANLTSLDVPHIEESFVEDERDGSGIGGGSTSAGRTGNNIKFGIKNIIPTSSFSTSNAPSHASHGTTGAGTTGSGLSKRGSGRRTMSIHQLDNLWQDSGSKLLNFVHHSAGGTNDKILEGGPQPSTSKALNAAAAKEDDDRKNGKITDWDRRSTSSSMDRQLVEDNLAMSSRSNLNERLPPGLGIFRSIEFLYLSNISYDGQAVLAIWKNMLCVVGNINKIEGPQNYATAMNCVVDIWDILLWIHAQQPYRDVSIPALYEVSPWLFEATEMPATYDAGRAAAFGCLCRLMSRRPEVDVSADYYTHFYKAILKGLASDDHVIIQAIIRNSERLFTFCLPGVYILIPPLFHAIEKQLLDGPNAKEIPNQVRKSCIIILASLASISNHLPDVQIPIDEDIKHWMQLKETEFRFKDIKVWLKDLLMRLVNADILGTQAEEDTGAHAMLLKALASVALDELLSCPEPQRDIIDDCLLALLNHLYWCNLTTVNTVVECLTMFAQIYRDDIDPDRMIVQEVLARIIDALNVHLKDYERRSKADRGLIISKLFSCLLEWLMVIEPAILSDTELCQLVFDVIEYAFHISLGDSEKMLPHPPPARTSSGKRKELAFKFKANDKRPVVHVPPAGANTSATVEMVEMDQSFVKESAEAVLFHLLHHFNNFPSPYGPATLHSTIVGPGLANDDKHDGEYEQYQYFALNDTTIVAFVELPASDTSGPQARMILRDLTGKYVWDAQLQPHGLHPENSPLSPEAGVNVSEDTIDNEQMFVVRSDIPIDNDDEPGNAHSSPVHEPCATENDPLNDLLKQIGDQHSDCLLDSTAPLNGPAKLSQLQMDMVGRLGEQLDDYLRDEAASNAQQESGVRLWYSKLNILRRKEARERAERTPESMHTHLMANFSLQKEFLPVFPHGTEKSHVPFQQCRLLMSHFGFINYEHLKDGSFQILKKSASLYRDLRGLDRKHGRETMKIGLIYVGLGQEDETSILQNDQGSEIYNDFVKSLGWEIDIATHTGYLGGLERNLTNGACANYYCTSTLEMIFHDVTKMPTDLHDPKQLKKKRHIGNDHVHIVWNEHVRDYRVGTIGGDFGNAQIIVTPLPNKLFSVQVYRDPKIPNFGPLMNHTIVSQATLGPLVRATAINAFRASVHTNLYSFYKSVFAHRANDVRTITQRHKVSSWNYDQFMEKIFMPDE